MISATNEIPMKPLALLAALSLMALPVTATPDAGHAAISDVGRLNGEALACGQMAVAAKELVIRRAPKSRRHGQVFRKRAMQPSSVRARRPTPCNRCSSPWPRSATRRTRARNGHGAYLRYAPRLFKGPTDQLLGFDEVPVSVWPSLAFSAEQATAVALDSASAKAIRPAVSFLIGISL